MRRIDIADEEEALRICLREANIKREIIFIFLSICVDTEGTVVV